MQNTSLTIFTIVFVTSLRTLAGYYGVSSVIDTHEGSYSFVDNRSVEFISEKYIEIGIFNPKFDASFGFGTSDSTQAKKETRSINLTYKMTPLAEAKWLQIGLGGYFDISSITFANGPSYGINDWYLRTQLTVIKSWEKSCLGLNIAPLLKIVSPKQSSQNSAAGRENIKVLANVYYAYEF